MPSLHSPSFDPPDRTRRRHLGRRAVRVLDVRDARPPPAPALLGIAAIQEINRKAPNTLFMIALLGPALVAVVVAVSSVTHLDDDQAKYRFAASVIYLVATPVTLATTSRTTTPSLRSTPGRSQPLVAPRPPRFAPTFAADGRVTRPSALAALDDLADPVAALARGSLEVPASNSS